MASCGIVHVGDIGSRDRGFDFESRRRRRRSRCAASAPRKRSRRHAAPRRRLLAVGRRRRWARRARGARTRRTVAPTALAVRVAGERADRRVDRAVRRSRCRRADWRGRRSRRRWHRPARRRASSRRADLHETAVAQHHDPVGDRQRFFLVVRDQQRRDALPGAGCGGSRRASSTRSRRIERRQRLVEQQRARLEHQRTRQRDALLLAARKLRRQAVARVPSPTQLRASRSRARAGARRRDAAHRSG